MSDPSSRHEKPSDWPAYFDAVAGLPARETLVMALDLFDRERQAAGALAVDLGCGEGRDTAELLRRGWRVLGIDSSAEGLGRMRERVRGVGGLERLEVLEARFEEARWPVCRLVNASFSIPHCDPRDFPGMWARIAASIEPGGRFAGQFFGVNDSWATRPDGVTRTYHMRHDVEGMLEPFDIERLDEVERPGKTALGEPKYWHVFHIVAKKR
jgi:SAM-dependent methyltransferase